MLKKIKLFWDKKIIPNIYLFRKEKTSDTSLVELLAGQDRQTGTAVEKLRSCLHCSQEVRRTLQGHSAHIFTSFIKLSINYLSTKLL